MRNLVRWVAGVATVLFGTVQTVPGQITFAPAVSYTVPGLNWDPCMATGDFNGDGHPDTAVCTAGDNGPGVAVFLNTGSGTFMSPIDYPTGGGTTRGLAAIDLNLDARPDLVALFGSNLNVRLNRGDGTFLPPVPYSLPNLTGTATSLIAGDFNRDGRKDVAVSYGGGNAIFLNRGDGTIAVSSTFLPAGAGGFFWQTPLTSTATA